MTNKKGNKKQEIIEGNAEQLRDYRKEDENNNE